MLLSEMIKGFFVVRRSRYTRQTTDGFRYCFRRAVRYFGEDREFDSIVADDIRGYVESMRSDGLIERSIHDHLTRLTALWSFAEDEFKLPNVIRQIEKPTYIEREIVPFTQSELKAILAAAEWTTEWSTRKNKQVRAKRPTGPRDLAILIVLVDVGLRASELCGLLVSDYQQDNGRLNVRNGKGGKSRSVFLGESAQRVVWRYLMTRTRIKPSDPLFATRTKMPITRTYLAHMVQRIGQNARIYNVHPHRFRHTFAIQFLRNGGNIFELQRILGHSELDTVKIYLQFADVDIERSQQANSPADNWRL